MKYLITGGCGFLGSNLASHIIKTSGELAIFDNLSRTGSTENLEWLKTQGDFRFYHLDTRSLKNVETAVAEFRPDVIFHLAGQVAMTTSIANPRLDFDTNVNGGFNLLEAVRTCSPDSIIAYSSTNKVYGDLEEFEYLETPTRFKAQGFEEGFDETIRLDFRSPYGCSKGSADQYMLDYARIFGLKTIVFRHSSIFGGRQFSTSDQGWVGWFVQQAVERHKHPNQPPFTICGNGKQVRDVLFADDLISCYFKAIENIDKTKGQAYNIGGGLANSLSLLELFKLLENELNVEMNFTSLPWRQSDQKVFIANTQKAFKDFNWKPEVKKLEGLQKMIKWVQSNV